MLHAMWLGELTIRHGQGKIALLNIRCYEDWMSKKSHLNLLVDAHMQRSAIQFRCYHR